MRLSGRPESWRVETRMVLDAGAKHRCSCIDLEVDILVRIPVLPRKEVIQPHLPVRLPCYDFTPITDPTLDACLPCGLAQRLQVLPTFVV